ncbi:MAG: restriction endonuclease subunit S [Sulfurimonadaceae bacterium]
MANNILKIGDFLKRVKNTIEIQDNETYKRVTIKTKNQGVFIRDIKLGSEIGTKKQFLISNGQFVLSKIDARFGAFGIANQEVDSAIITGNFWAYDVDTSIVNIDLFNIFTSSKNFIDICAKASSGTTHRKYLDEKKFLNFEVSLPDINEQNNVITSYKRKDQIKNILESEISNQQQLLKKLRQSILQDAIEGKLTASWREQNPDVEIASTLLEKIKAEKEQLVKEKKIKKQKPLPLISEDEMPFDIPGSWEWCRLGEVSSKIGSGSTPRGSNYSEKGIPFFRSQNIHNNGLVYRDIKYISDETHKKMSGTKVLPEDILLNITGGSMGRCAYVPKDFGDANLSQHVCIIRPILLNPIFVHNLVLSPVFQDMIFSSTTGAGREGLPKNNLEQFVIPIIPVEEQQQIVQKIKNLFKICAELETQIDSSKINSQTLMQAVLKEAFEQKEENLPKELEAEVVTALIIDKFQNKKKFGRVKLQKILYLHETVNNLDYGSSYKKIKHAMGPHDYEFLKKIENNLKEKEWFNKVQEEGDKGRTYYPPLSKADEYKKHLSAVQNLKELEELINAMMDFDLNQSEVVATLYAVWKEENDHNIFGTVSDDILIKKALGWHDHKDNIPKEHWPWGINWLRSQKFLF